MESCILASAGRWLWRYLSAHNIDADAHFRGCGLDPSLIHESLTRYSYSLLCKAFVEASVITQNENIGLECPKYYSPLDLNALGITFLSSSTLFEALQRLVRYESVVNSNLMFSIIELKDQLHLVADVPDIPREAIRIIEDARTAILVSLCRQGLVTSLDPLEVAFTYPEPKSSSKHVEVFRCTLKFSQPVSRIVFNIADARHPFTAANRALAVSNDQILEGMMYQLNNADIVSRVKRVIIDDLPSGTPSEEDIAKALFVSCRTLQRRLVEENTNFRTLLSEVRRELAEKYIADKTMPMAEISYMLGFSDTSSFSRAFRKWTGDAPATFRNNLYA